jgi:hypothetical protein
MNARKPGFDLDLCTCTHEYGSHNGRGPCGRCTCKRFAPVASLAASAADTSPAPPPEVEDLAEQCDRARTVARALEGCEQELERLEDIPSADADDVNALSAAKGYVQRARTILARRFA